jgi:hypothetical protein
MTPAEAAYYAAYERFLEARQALFDATAAAFPPGSAVMVKRNGVAFTARVTSTCSARLDPGKFQARRSDTSQMVSVYPGEQWVEPLPVHQDRPQGAISAAATLR